MRRLKIGNGARNWVPLTALGLTLAMGLALAAPNDDKERHHCEGWHHHGQWTLEKRQDFFAHRMRDLHDKLSLTAAQEPAWKDFVAQMKPSDTAQKIDFKEFAKLPAPDRLDKQLEWLKTHETALANRAQQVRQLYGTLTPAQQKSFDDNFMRFGRHHHRHQGSAESHASQ